MAWKRSSVRWFDPAYDTAPPWFRALLVNMLTEGLRKWSISELWREASPDPEKAHNSQMDVVMALWKNELIVRKE
jgi:hypothetical protein